MTRSKLAALAAVLALGAIASACRADVATTVATTVDADPACVAIAVAAVSASAPTATRTCPGVRKVVATYTPPIQPPPGGGTTQTITFAESMEDFLNPARGMYVTPNDSEMDNVATLSRFVTVWNTRLFTYAPNMSGFMNAPLSAAWLSTLTQRLANARSAGVKIVLLPRYQDGGTCVDSPQWKTHIGQLGPVLKANADVLADPIRAGMAGAWGEGWCSSNGIDYGGANTAAFRDAWNAARPPTHHIAFHTVLMGQWASSYPWVASKNDCLWANDTDAHNYAGGLNDPLRTTIKNANRTPPERPYGGESCENVSDQPAQAQNSCPQILANGPAYGLSFLNKSYAALFLDRWKADGCFDQVSRSIGYRFFVPKIVAPISAQANKPVTIVATVKGVGWSPIFDDRPLVISLRNKATGAVVSGGAGKLRQVAAGQSVDMGAIITPPGAGTFEILISAPDLWPSLAADVRYAVRFANQDAGAAKWTAPYFNTGATVAVQ